MTQITHARLLRQNAIDSSNSPIGKTKKKDPVKMFQKKHVRNAEILKKSKREDCIRFTVNGWIKAGQAKLDREMLKTYLDCIKNLIKLMGYRFTKTLLLPTIIYADKFVQSSGLLDSTQIFHLLLISSLVATKFWEDTGADMNLASYISGISKKEICDMERTFLKSIDFALFIDQEDVDEFENRPRGETPLEVGSS
eukprot:TRINITY_DN15414_c0_g1_i1.p1 TRINITY_DN15414_c0_g1~~TRINITY_DN15414_c0_g1_i1.p1  ORF type:complete len:196 (+),score=38.29 TRINITY_DN15414_c0_g1_i1:326-913(+)